MNPLMIFGLGAALLGLALQTKKESDIKARNVPKDDKPKVIPQNVETINEPNNNSDSSGVIEHSLF